MIHRIISLIIRLIMYANGGLKVIGRDKIPLQGGVIVAPNHISYLDPPVIGAVLPRKATFMARKGLFDIPILGWSIRYYAFPVDREKTHPSTIKETVRRLKNGELLVIFPEGKRSETGKLLEGKRGIGMIARLSNVPIVPALIKGTNNALPVGAKWLRRAGVTVIFDTPILPSALLDEKSKNTSEDITQKIMDSIKEIEKTICR